ncbi:hypothetical protein H2198_004546 [Neophaeococcomyces mojaviensis]|uniref:Uncharacterized protein n=1 Tax=Neophaeococcomyces mojaviensis TaxID=3383035 RepID=A0ACC3A863_9EURO|nr:hypothetical protein H2198_004546 [Knufia sp. JES_112]
MAILTHPALPFPVTYTHLFLVVVVLFVASVYIQRYAAERKIRRLGLTAPIIPTYLPWGLDMPIKACNYFLRNRAMDAWLDEWKKLGALETLNYTMELRILTDIRVIMTADPENIKAILTSQFQDYGKGQQFHLEWQDFLGDSIFTTDGKQWSDSRALIRPMFQRERVADLNIIEQHVQELFTHLGPGDARQVDMRNLFFRFAMDASTHFLFGHSAGSLVNEQTEFATAFDEVQRKQALAGRAGPLRHFLPMKSFYEGLKTMDRFIEPWITEALSLTPEELEGKLKKQDTFLHALARHTRDWKVIRDQLVALLLAGRDTTSTTLSWMILELARHPLVLRKLRAEIAQNVGTSRSARPTYENIKNMKYLTWIINETLRLYPVVPFNVRTSLHDTTLPRGGGKDGSQPIGIPKNTAVGYSTLIMQRRRDLYPEISETFPYEPDQWVPERWATWQPKGHAGWTFIPFNGGPRICIGQQFAMVEMAYVIIRLFTEYDKLFDYGNDNVEFGITITLAPHPGVKVGFGKDEKGGL